MEADFSVGLGSDPLPAGADSIKFINLSGFRLETAQVEAGGDPAAGSIVLIDPIWDSRGLTMALDGYFNDFLFSAVHVEAVKERFYNWEVSSFVNFPGLDISGLPQANILDSEGNILGVATVEFPESNVDIFQEGKIITIETLRTIEAPELPIGATSAVLALLGFGAFRIRRLTH